MHMLHHHIVSHAIRMRRTRNFTWNLLNNMPVASFGYSNNDFKGDEEKKEKPKTLSLFKRNK